MKLNLIIPSFYPATVYGGPIFSSLNTCRELASVGVDVMVCTTNANGKSKLEIETDKIIVFGTNFKVKYYDETIIGKFSFQFLINIREDIKSADVIHIQSVFSISTPVSLSWAVKLKKPIILSPRGQFGGWCLEQRRITKESWIKIFIKPFQKFILWHATSLQEYEEILYIFPEAIIKIIPNGIDLKSFNLLKSGDASNFYKRFYPSFEDGIGRVIVSMGRLNRVKGFDVLIRSFKIILDSIPGSSLFIAGSDDGEKHNLVTLVKSLGLEGKVFFTGELLNSDKINFLANADVFVLPSHNENFGNVYIESLAAGTPIVASKNTPWSEVEVYGCGKWVDNTVESTGGAMLEVLSKDRDEMRQKSKAYAAKFDWSNVARKFKVVYQELIM